MLVYGAFGVVCLTHSTSRLTGVVVAVVVILTMAIAASRVWIGAHNVAEVLIGLGVGATALGAFTAGYRRLPHPPVNLTVLAILAVAGLLLAYGAHAPAEKLVAELGALIRSQSGVCGSTA
jgi:membrane-associated phospholipid phosphatase